MSCRQVRRRTGSSFCAKRWRILNKDPEFVADAKKARLDLAPLSGEELEKIVERTYNLDKALVAKLKEILK